MYDIIVLKISVFVRPHVNGKPAFSNLKSPLWRAFLKRYVFGDRFHRIRADGRPNRRKKNLRFQIKTDTCGRGLKEIAIYFWALYDGLRKSHTTFPVACVTDSLNLGTNRYFFEGGRWGVENFLMLPLPG